ncbi:sensor histidine kinase [Amycolatopsis sp. CA-230715]|uniref:sensor histidine kinase n=1 Tax=Amycolatopsis sp. CA-230715 TaxID=2745196 RepID=UPI001C01B2F5|nr:histidine kinase [Amycolatopsis sp. CA-230715]
MSDPVRRLDKVLLGAVVLAGGFLPRGNRGPSGYVERALAPDWLPWYVRAALCVVALLAVIVTLPRRQWLFFGVALLAFFTVLSWPAVCVASYFAALVHRPAVLAGYVSAAGVALAVALPGNGQDFGAALAGWAGEGGLFVVLPVALGRWTRFRREVIAGHVDRAERLRREQESKAAEARAAERAGIARDMHDVVAHRVSLMVLHAGAIEVNAADERISAEAALIRTTGREALAQLRQVLGILTTSTESTEQATLSGVEGLVSRSEAAGLPVMLKTEGVPRELPPAVEHAAYRLVQEGLTNVHKHAGLATTEVGVRYLPSALDVSVRNAAPPSLVAELPGSGLGLIGVAERIETLGGDLSSGPRLDGGFALSARIPAPEAEET